MRIIHHGAQFGVTGSCHELKLEDRSLLVDCGLYQGADRKFQHHANAIDIPSVELLVLTHVHIDHVGRVPWLIWSGYQGPIYLTKASARLLPEVLSDAMEFDNDIPLEDRERVLEQLTNMLVPCDYDQNIKISLGDQDGILRFRIAGHILGSAFVEMHLAGKSITFSGDLGCKNTPLLPDVAKHSGSDYLLIESTYGDHLHESRLNRHQALRRAVDKTIRNQGTTIIPAFSIGRTQELIYEFEQIFTEVQPKGWSRLPVVVDSPLANRFTRIYRQFKQDWDREAKALLEKGSKPLSFDNLVTIDEFQDHVTLLDRLKQRGESAIVIAASGMCEGGRVVDLLRELLPDERTDVLFVGYQAEGTLGRELLSRPKCVEIDGEQVPVNASINRIGGYSAHADQSELLDFIGSSKRLPKHVRIIHGEPTQQRAFAQIVASTYPSVEVSQACDGKDLRLD